MTKTVVIHQPDYAPYLGFFERFVSADLYIVLDHVQFSSSGWTHRDKIKTPQGEKWLSISISNASLGTPINEIRLSDRIDWACNNLNLIRQNYRNADHFDEIFSLIEPLYEDLPTLLADFNIRMIDVLTDRLGVRVPHVLSSDLSPRGVKNELLIDLLYKVGATRYLSGTGARSYMQPEVFAAAGIEVVWQSFEHPVYRQQFGEFIPYLSILDALLNCGVEKTQQLIGKER